MKAALVTARRLKDKGVTPSEEFHEIETIDQTPRLLGAPELVGLFDDAALDAEVLPAFAPAELRRGKHDEHEEPAVEPI